MEVSGYDEEPSLFSDWGDPREFSVGDIGIGECAGEVISRFAFDLAASERTVFEAQVRLDEGDGHEAAVGAYRAVLRAPDALLRSVGVAESSPTAPGPEVEAASERIVDAFRRRFFNTKLFFDPYAGPKFANYLFSLHETVFNGVSVANARAYVEEAQLFIEASHACHARLIESGEPVGGDEKKR